MTDAELLEGLINRDSKAWRSFNQTYEPLIRRCIQKVVGRFPALATAEDINDIYSMMLLNLTAESMKRLRAFDPSHGTKLSSWFGMIATNTAWDFIRCVARRPISGQVELEVAPLAAADPSPFDACVERERAVEASRLLDGFSERDQEFVRLFYLDGCEPDEIAASMGISVKTVYTKKHKILARLEGAAASQAAA